MKTVAIRYFDFFGINNAWPQMPERIFINCTRFFIFVTTIKELTVSALSEKKSRVPLKEITVKC